jgi:translation initiation factor IF-3
MWDRRPPFFRRFDSAARRVRINDYITAKTVRVIGPTGEMLGIFPRDLALRKAEEFSLDLVEVAPTADPPVTRIIDFSKYRYDQEKKEKEAKRHQKQFQLKEIRLSPRIDPHDYETKLKHVKEFLGKKHKVRLRMLFKGREMAHKEIANKIIERVVQDTSSIAVVDKPPLMLGRALLVILAPK